MKQRATLWLTLAATITLGLASTAHADKHRLIDRWALRFARTQNWHGAYGHDAYGQPVGLIVPPIVQMQVGMGWGVSQSSMTPIYHQYRRPFPGYVEGDVRQTYATPNWPSHTDQMGVYYIRGPW